MANPRFGLAFDPAAALKQLRKDHELARVFRRVGPFSLSPGAGPSPFESLAKSIIHQQLNGRAAASIFRRFRELFQKPMKPEHVLSMDDETLRGAGLSRAKAIAIRDLAGKAREGLLPSWAELRKMEDEDIIQRLTQVKGVGRWTVEMLLIFHLGRPDVWPVDDFAIRMAYGNLFGIEKPSQREMVARAESWRPYRTVVAWYLWRSLEV